MVHIHSISSISHQATFASPGFSKNLRRKAESSLILPDYKEYIDPSLLRRMSPILRMSVACATFCQNQINNKPFDAIIIGTGSGCLLDTQKFLDNFILLKGLIPPTSFIQSTHNTMAGQISIALKNQSYNTTYSQNTVSFEMALQDGLLHVQEGADHVLVGGADEHIPFLDKISGELHMPEMQFTSGVSYMVLSNQKTDTSHAAVLAVKTIFHPTSLHQETDKFLEENQLNLNAFDAIYYAQLPTNAELHFPGIETKNLGEFFGYYPTLSAMGVHLAADEINGGAKNRILIMNLLNPRHFGFIIIQKAL